MADELFPKAPPAKPSQVDAAFRNGSVTAIGVVLAFSLGFLNNWAAQPSAWTLMDFAAVSIITGGLGFQIRALAGMLSIASLEILVYERLIRVFLIGLALVSAGVIVAILGDLIGFGQNVLGR